MNQTKPKPLDLEDSKSTFMNVSAETTPRISGDKHLQKNSPSKIQVLLKHTGNKNNTREINLTNLRHLTIKDDRELNNISGISRAQFRVMTDDLDSSLSTKKVNKESHQINEGNLGTLNKTMGDNGIYQPPTNFDSMLKEHHSKQFLKCQQKFFETIREIDSRINSENQKISQADRSELKKQLYQLLSHNEISYDTTSWLTKQQDSEEFSHSQNHFFNFTEKSIMPQSLHQSTVQMQTNTNLSINCDNKVWHDSTDETRKCMSPPKTSNETTECHLLSSMKVINTVMQKQGHPMLENYSESADQNQPTFQQISQVLSQLPSSVSSRGDENTHTTSTKVFHSKIVTAQQSPNTRFWKPKHSIAPDSTTAKADDSKNDNNEVETNHLTIQPTTDAANSVQDLNSWITTNAFQTKFRQIPLRLQNTTGTIGNGSGKSRFGVSQRQILNGMQSVVNSSCGSSKSFRKVIQNGTPHNKNGINNDFILMTTNLLLNQKKHSKKHIEIQTQHYNDCDSQGQYSHSRMKSRGEGTKRLSSILDMVNPAATDVQCQTKLQPPNANPEFSKYHEMESQLDGGDDQPIGLFEQNNNTNLMGHPQLTNSANYLQTIPLDSDNISQQMQEAQEKVEVIFTQQNQQPLLRKPTNTKRSTADEPPASASEDIIERIQHPAVQVFKAKNKDLEVSSPNQSVGTNKEKNKSGPQVFNIAFLEQEIEIAPSNFQARQKLHSKLNMSANYARHQNNSSISSLKKEQVCSSNFTKKRSVSGKNILNLKKNQQSHASLLKRSPEIQEDDEGFTTYQMPSSKVQSQEKGSIHSKQFFPQPRSSYLFYNQFALGTKSLNGYSSLSQIQTQRTEKETGNDIVGASTFKQPQLVSQSLAATIQHKASSISRKVGYSKGISSFKNIRGSKSQRLDTKNKGSQTNNVNFCQVKPIVPPLLESIVETVSGRDQAKVERQSIKKTQKNETSFVLLNNSYTSAYTRREKQKNKMLTQKLQKGTSSTSMRQLNLKPRIKTKKNKNNNLENKFKRGLESQVSKEASNDQGSNDNLKVSFNIQSPHPQDPNSQNYDQITSKIPQIILKNGRNTIGDGQFLPEAFMNLREETYNFISRPKKDTSAASSTEDELTKCAQSSRQNRNSLIQKQLVQVSMVGCDDINPGTLHHVGLLSEQDGLSEQSKLIEELSLPGISPFDSLQATQSANQNQALAVGWQSQMKNSSEKAQNLSLKHQFTKKYDTAKVFEQQSKNLDIVPETHSSGFNQKERNTHTQKDKKIDQPLTFTNDSPRLLDKNLTESMSIHLRPSSEKKQHPTNIEGWAGSEDLLFRIESHSDLQQHEEKLANQKRRLIPVQQKRQQTSEMLVETPSCSYSIANNSFGDDQSSFRKNQLISRNNIAAIPHKSYLSNSLAQLQSSQSNIQQVQKAYKENKVMRPLHANLKTKISLQASQYSHLRSMKIDERGDEKKVLARQSKYQPKDHMGQGPEFQLIRFNKQFKDSISAERETKVALKSPKQHLIQLNQIKNKPNQNQNFNNLEKSSTLTANCSTILDHIIKDNNSSTPSSNRNNNQSYEKYSLFPQIVHKTTDLQRYKKQIFAEINPKKVSESIQSTRNTLLKHFATAEMNLINSFDFQNNNKTQSSRNFNFNQFLKTQDSASLLRKHMVQPLKPKANPIIQTDKTDSLPSQQLPSSTITVIPDPNATQAQAPLTSSCSLLPHATSDAATRHLTNRSRTHHLKQQLEFHRLAKHNNPSRLSNQVSGGGRGGR